MRNVALNRDLKLAICCRRDSRSGTEQLCKGWKLQQLVACTDDARSGFGKLVHTLYLKVFDVDHHAAVSRSPPSENCQNLKTGKTTTPMQSTDTTTTTTTVAASTASSCHASLFHEGSNLAQRPHIGLAAAGLPSNALHSCSPCKH